MNANTLITHPVGTAPSITPDQVALALIDDGYTEANGGKSAFAAGGDMVTKLALELADGSFAKKEPTKVEQMMKTLVWPLPRSEDKVEKGELSKVESCIFSGRTALGACEVVGGKRDGDWAVTWRFTWTHFGVREAVDTDGGMRRCLKIGGKWIAAAEQDPAVIRERLRQHAQGLNDLLGR